MIKINKLPLATYSISAIILLIFFVARTNPDYYINLFGFVPFSINIYSIVTYAFIHTGIFHVLGNVTTFLFIGNIMEKYIGSSRLILIFLISTMFSIPFEIIGRVFFDIPSTIPLIGASGAIFGLLTFSVIFRPNEKIPTWFIFYSFIPLLSLSNLVFPESGIRIIAIVLYLLILNTILIAFRLPKKIPFNFTALIYYLNWIILLLTIPPLPISFFGHIGGAVGGFLMFLYFYRKKVL